MRWHFSSIPESSVLLALHTTAVKSWTCGHSIKSDQSVSPSYI
jgi:hypothetical protein